MHSLCFNGNFPGGPGLTSARMSPFWILLKLRVIEMVVLNALLSGFLVMDIMFKPPRAGSGVVRMDPLHFLAGSRTRRLNQAWFLFYILACFLLCWCLLGPLFYVLLVFIIMCCLSFGCSS